MTSPRIAVTSMAALAVFTSVLFALPPAPAHLNADLARFLAADDMAAQAPTPPAAAAPNPDDPLPDGKGKDVVKKDCSGCHSVAAFADQRHTKDKWADIVDNMVSKGMSASDAEIDTITNYLATNLAPKATPPAAQK